MYKKKTTSILIVLIVLILLILIFINYINFEGKSKDSEGKKLFRKKGRL